MARATRRNGSKRVVTMRHGRSLWRVIGAAVVVVALVATFVVRLADIQLVEASALQAEAAQHRGVDMPLFGSRGDIVDVNGQVLAESVMRWDITVSPQYVRDIELADGSILTGGAVFEQLGALTGRDPQVFQAAVYAALEENPESDYLLLVGGVDLEVRNAVLAMQVPYITLARHPSRVYPMGAVAGNLVGFMGTDEALAGLELYENACLQDIPGSMSYTRGADGTIIPGSEVAEDPAQDGGTLQLTIDADLQYLVQQELAEAGTSLAATWGSIVVMRTDGTLAAVADWPSVDPNDPTATPSEYRGSLSFNAMFEPGSIFKSIAAAVFVETGIATPLSQTLAPWEVYLPDGVYVSDASVHGDAPFTLTGALVHSSNVGMVQLSDGLSTGTYLDYIHDFGFGTPTEVNFGGQPSGIVHDLADVDAQTAVNMYFGQGIATTAVQMASSYQVFANGGVREPVRLVESCTMPDGTVIEPDLPEGEQVISAATATETLLMLEHVVTDSGITTFPIEGYRVAAKTGTAEVALPGGVGYDPVNRVTSVAGVFPVDNPQYVVMVMFHSPANNQTSTGVTPVFHDVVSLLIRHYSIPPSTGEPAPYPIEW